MIVGAWDGLMNLIRSKEEVKARSIIEKDARVQEFINEHGRPSRFESWCVCPAFEKRKLTDRYPDTPTSHTVETQGSDSKDITRFVLSGKDKTLKLVRGLSWVGPAYGGRCEAHRLNIYYDVKQEKIVELIDVTLKYTGHPDPTDGWSTSDVEIKDTKTLY